MNFGLRVENVTNPIVRAVYFPPTQNEMGKGPAWNHGDQSPCHGFIDKKRGSIFSQTVGELVQILSN